MGCDTKQNHYQKSVGRSGVKQSWKTRSVLSCCSFSSGIFSESDREEEACLPGRAVENGDKDASVFVAEAARSEDLIVVRPKVRPQSCRPAAPSAHGNLGPSPPIPDLGCLGHSMYPAWQLGLSLKSKERSL